MMQEEFDKRKAAQINALRCFAGLDEKPAVKVIDLVEMLLGQNPSLPVIVQEGNRRFPVVWAWIDGENGVRLQV